MTSNQQLLTLDEQGNVVWRDPIHHRFPLPFELADVLLGTANAPDDLLKGRTGHVIGLRADDLALSVLDYVVSVHWEGEGVEDSSYGAVYLGGWAWIVERVETTGLEPSLGGAKSAWPKPLRPGDEGWLEAEYERIEMLFQSELDAGRLTRRDQARQYAFRQHAAALVPPPVDPNYGRAMRSGTTIPLDTVRWPAVGLNTAVIMNIDDAEVQRGSPTNQAFGIFASPFGNVIANPNVPPGQVYLLSTPSAPVARGGYTTHEDAPRCPSCSNIRDITRTETQMNDNGPVAHFYLCNNCQHRWSQRVQRGGSSGGRFADYLNRIRTGGESSWTTEPSPPSRARAVIEPGEPGPGGFLVPPDQIEAARAWMESADRTIIRGDTITIPLGDTGNYGASEIQERTIRERWQSGASNYGTEIDMNCPRCAASPVRGVAIENMTSIEGVDFTCPSCQHRWREAVLVEPPTYEIQSQPALDVTLYPTSDSYRTALEGWRDAQQTYAEAFSPPSPARARTLRAIHRRYTGALERARTFYSSLRRPE